MTFLLSRSLAKERKKKKKKEKTITKHFQLSPLKTKTKKKLILRRDSEKTNEKREEKRIKKREEKRIKKREEKREEKREKIGRGPPRELKTEERRAATTYFSSEARRIDREER